MKPNAPPSNYESEEERDNNRKRSCCVKWRKGQRRKLRTNARELRTDARKLQADAQDEFEDALEGAFEEIKEELPPTEMRDQEWHITQKTLKAGQKLVTAGQKLVEAGQNLQNAERLLQNAESRTICPSCQREELPPLHPSAPPPREPRVRLWG